MLGGGVGLMADLALMAQAAGLAREVSVLRDRLVYNVMIGYISAIKRFSLMTRIGIVESKLTSVRFYEEFEAQH
jgi:hypothetical protein